MGKSHCEKKISQIWEKEPAAVGAQERPYPSGPLPPVRPPPGTTVRKKVILQCCPHVKIIGYEIHYYFFRFCLIPRIPVNNFPSCTFRICSK